MSQTRRPSTTTKLGKHPLSPNDINQATKNGGHSTSSQGGPQAKHRRLSTNQNKSHPVVKRDIKLPSDVPEDELKAGPQVQEETTASPPATSSCRFSKTRDFDPMQFARARRPPKFSLFRSGGKRNSQSK